MNPLKRGSLLAHSMVNKLGKEDIVVISKQKNVFLSLPNHQQKLTNCVHKNVAIHFYQQYRKVYKILSVLQIHWTQEAEVLPSPSKKRQLSIMNIRELIGPTNKIISSLQITRIKSNNYQNSVKPITASLAFYSVAVAITITAFCHFFSQAQGNSRRPSSTSI